MNAPRERSVTLTVFGATPTHATAVLVSQSGGRRLARALGALVACWSAAIAAIFIPLAHFFLVPGLVVAGVIWAGLLCRERERLLRVYGICPRCAREAEFVPGGSQGGQPVVSCPGCRNRLLVTIERSESPGPPDRGQPPKPTPPMPQRREDPDDEPDR